MENEGVFMASTSEKELEIIKKDNRLIQARYRVGLHEQRILYAVLGAIRVDDKGFDTYTIDLRQLAQMHGITASNDLYRQIQAAAEQLLVTIVDISMGTRTRKTTWLNYVEYVAGEAELKVTIHEKLKPYLLQLKANFTQYQLAAVANFRNSYSIRFYELLKMRQNMGKGGRFYIEYNLLELKEILGISMDEYRYTKDLRVRVIEPALQEIDEQTDLNIIFKELEYPKKGRAIYAVKIVAEPKKQRMLAIEDPKDITPQESQPEQRPKAVQALLDFGFSESEARALVRTHKGEKVTQALAYVAHKRQERELKDPCAYMRTILKGDGGEKWAKQQQEAQESRQKRLFEERQQANAEAERAERERAETKQAQTAFEALEPDEQEALLDAFLDELEASNANAMMLDRFHKGREKGEAHRVPMLYAHFKRVMREHGFL
jgi:plasmid replication initiation protein